MTVIAVELGWFTREGGGGGGREELRHKKKEIFYLMRNSIVHIFRVEELS
jgi:hypothetical protein